MTKFKLKISGKNIEIFQDNEAIGEGDDYKEVLAYVATLIVKKDIDDYEVWLYEKGEKVKLTEKNFDPESIVKNSKKIKQKPVTTNSVIIIALSVSRFVI